MPIPIPIAGSKTASAIYEKINTYISTQIIFNSEVEVKAFKSLRVISSAHKELLKLGKPQGVVAKIVCNLIFFFYTARIYN